ncbi:MAG: hypothetical protein NZ560_03835 [Aquificaceae bacterium]|nr:hypothetical protein [Aquificaceae bacterium]MDW8097486.1 hypothetical protein [Aquificaceae bacterium]
MIKINLIGDKEKKKGKSLALDLTALRGLRLQDLSKLGVEYYAGLAAWLILPLVLAYYWNVNKERASLKAELDRLNAEKTSLQARANKFLEEKKALEDSIATLKKSIQEIEGRREIIFGLKTYYEPFSRGLDFYSSRVPKTAWINSYRQNLDISKQTLGTELEIGALDYASLTSYGRALNLLPGKASLSQLERKTTPNGFEYYTAKLSAEINIEGR